MNEKALEKMLAFVANPPTVRLEQNVNYDGPTLIIGDGFLCIRETTIKVKSILGTQEVDGFVLEKATYQPATRYYPEEHDYQEVFSSRNFNDVAKAAVKEYVSHLINNMLNEDSVRAEAEEYEEDKKRLAKAEQEGREMVDFSEQANPYPWGTAYHHAWLRGRRGKRLENEQSSR